MNNDLHPLVLLADAFANAAHAAVGQFRKYSKEPYIVHPRHVRQLVLAHATRPVSPEMEAASLLHDTVEDTGVTIELIEEVFGERVAKLVSDLTDVSKPEDGNRKTRKALDLQHTAAADPDSKTVKLADLISNSGTIVDHDPGFARTWLREKEALLEVLEDGDPGLLALARSTLEASLRNLNGANSG